MPTLRHWPDDGLSVNLGPPTLSLAVAGRPQTDAVDDETLATEARITWAEPTGIGFDGPAVRVADGRGAHSDRATVESSAAAMELSVPGSTR